MKKILHIFPDSLFIESYLSLLANDKKYRHQFILTNIGANMEFDTSKYNKYEFYKISTFKFFDFIKLRKLLKKNEYDSLIIHSGYLNYLLLALIFNRKVVSKTVLSLWGGSDSQEFSVKKENRKYIIQAKVYEYLRCKLYKKVKAIASIVPEDYNTVKKIYNLNCKNYPSLYPFLPNISDNFSKKKDKTIKIQICHSGSPFCNSLEVLDILKKYKNEDIIIYASLAYGDKEYISKVVKKGKSIFKEKFIPNFKLLSAGEYANYISKLNVLINNSNIQQGLGNIYLALCSGVKVFINIEGVIFQELKKKNIKSFNVEHIKKMDLEAFVKITDIDKQSNHDNCLDIFDVGNALNLWYDIFDKE